MFGIGASELVIIVIIGLVLFGTPLLTFLLGYTLGKKSTDLPARETPDDVEPAERTEDEAE